MNRIIISHIPKISAIYFALLQWGYDYHSVGRNEEHIEALRQYLDDKMQLEFFSKVRQAFCEVYPYWPRAALLEKAAFYLNEERMCFEEFDILYENIMSAGNISDEERNQSFWEWINDFPHSLCEILSNDTFANYLEWEKDWISQQKAKYEKELQMIQRCVEACVNKYNSQVQVIQIVLNPIKCVYSADYHLHEKCFVFCSGEFKTESIIHEFLHHIVHPIVIAQKNVVLSRKTEFPDVDNSYYLVGNEEGYLNAFEEYMVRELTKDILAGKYPSDIAEYLKDWLQ